MIGKNWLRSLKRTLIGRPAPTIRRKPRKTLLRTENLEDRAVPAVLDTFLTNEHVDIRINHSAGTWSIQAQDADNAVTHEMEDALLYVGTHETEIQGAGFEFIGAGNGNPYHLLPQSQNPELLYLGVAGYGVLPSTVDRYNPGTESKGRINNSGRWVKMSLIEVAHTNPDGTPGNGAISTWQNEIGGPNVFWSTFNDGIANANGNGLDVTDGVSADDAMWITAGGHLHYNFAFTQLGRYEVKARTSTYFGDNANNTTPNLTGFSTSGNLTMYFSVGSVGKVDFDATTYTVDEGAGNATITVRRTGGSDGQLTVNYATVAGGSATVVTDYANTTGTLTFLDGETSKTFTIPIVNDSSAEGNETVNLLLSTAGPSNLNSYLNETGSGLLGTHTSATLAIRDQTVAINDSFSVRPGHSLHANVLRNDFDRNLSHTVNANLISGPAHGNLTLNAGGSFTYTPGLSFAGSDSFVYLATDTIDGGQSGNATVTISASVEPDFVAAIYEGHTDVGVGYDAEWDLHVHDEENDAEYEPDEVLLSVGELANTTRPGGTQFDFIGVVSGAPIWLIQQSFEVEGIPYLGLATEEIDDGVFLGNVTSMSLVSVSGPGHFSLWKNGMGGPEVAFATSDGVTSSDLRSLLTGGHSHFNWAFTAPGAYEIAVEASGTLANGTETSSGPVTYYFLVGNHEPEAVNDSYVVGANNSVRGNVLFNDSDEDGDTLTTSLVTGPAHGTLTLNSDGTFTYTPGMSFVGTDSFVYTAHDGIQPSGNATVTINAAGFQSVTALIHEGHTDIGVAFEGGEFDLHVHDEENDIEYHADEVMLAVGDDAATTRPAGTQFDFIGVGNGSPIWLINQSSEVEGVPYLGLATEEIDDGVFVGDFVTMSLLAVNGPGHVSLWKNEIGGPEVAFATSDGITAQDATTLLTGSHSHYNWAFTAPGRYEVTVQVTGTLVGNTTPINSGPVTYYFSVDNLGQVQFDPTSYSVTEGGNTTITVTRTGGSNGPITVNLAATGGNASLGDYSGLANITFGDGETSKTITLSALTDSLVEGPETLTLGLSAPLDSATELGNATNATVTIADATAPLQITAIQVNGGAAQRSNVQTLSITFNNDTNIASLISGNTIQNVVRVFTAGGVQVTLPASRYQYNAGTRTLTIDLTVDGFGGSGASMLADGRYQLRITAASITTNGNSPHNQLQDTDGTVDGTHRFNFHRLAGDSDGDGDVDTADFQRFRAAMFTTTPTNLAAFDFDGDGDIDMADYNRVRANLGRRI